MYHNDRLLDAYGMHNGKQIAVQITAEKEEAKSDSILITIRSWNPLSWEMSEMYEMYCPKSMTLDNLGATLSALFGLPQSDVECCKIGSAWNFSRIQLPSENWTKTNGNQCFIVSAPFYMSVDGGLIIVKKSGYKERELNADEKARFAAFDYELHGTYRSLGKGPKKEKAIKINVYQPHKEEKEKKEDPAAKKS